MRGPALPREMSACSCPQSGQISRNKKPLRVSFNCGPNRSQIVSTQDPSMNTAVKTRVRLRPQGVVVALRDTATNNASFPVGKFRRTRDTAIMMERKGSDLHD
jgi:hypothetical protein